MVVRVMMLVAGLLIMAFGAACLNYAKPSTLQHHLDWASDGLLPGPSDQIVWVGFAAVALGGLLVGLAAARLGSATRRTRP